MERYDEKKSPWKNPLEKLNNFSIYADGFPVTPGHLLFVPHINSDTMIAECLTGAFHRGNRMVHIGEWEAFNVGFNSGPAAGQTVNWPHVHLIPRRTGDVSDPTGGVRGVIPSKQSNRNI